MLIDATNIHVSCINSICNIVHVAGRNNILLKGILPSGFFNHASPNGQCTTISNPPTPKWREIYAFYWFLPCRDLLPVSLFCIQFPGFLVPRCALLFWGIFVRGLRFETFVRVLRSSELSLNNCK